MDDQIERIEAFLDQTDEPMQVLRELPGSLRLDPAQLTAGSHELRLRSHLRGGQESEQRVSFTVDHSPGLVIEGLRDGETLRGEVIVSLRPAVAAAEAAGTRRRHSWLYVVAAVVALGAIWTLSLVYGPDLRPVSPATADVTPAAAPSGSASAGDARPASAKSPGFDKALWAKGRTLYPDKCAACHQADGHGVPGTFPPLADNKNLADAKMCINAVLKGKSGKIKVNGETYNGQMPPVAGISDHDAAAVLTFVRNSWGNHYGTVTPEQVKAQR